MKIHFPFTKDLKILSELSRCFLSIGNCAEAIRCSDLVLQSNSSSLEAIIVKVIFLFISNVDELILHQAEALYNMCKFEHSFALFSKVMLPAKLRRIFKNIFQGSKLYPEAEEIKAGVLKCRKTISNKV